MMKEAMVAGTFPNTRQRWRVPFSIRTSPGDSDSFRAVVELECQVAGENDPEIRRVGPVKAGVSSTSSSPSSRCISGVGSGAMKSPGKYVPMISGCHLRVEYTARRRIVPRVRVGCGLIGIPEEGEFS